jgi:hypothetical protein
MLCSQIVNVFIKKCLNSRLGITNQNKCAINHYVKMIQLFCCGYFLGLSLCIMSLDNYKNTLLAITINVTRSTMRLMFFIISRLVHNWED